MSIFSKAKSCIAWKHCVTAVLTGGDIHKYFVSLVKKHLERKEFGFVYFAAFVSVTAFPCLFNSFMNIIEHFSIS